MTSASPHPAAPLALLHRLDAHDRALFTRWARRAEPRDAVVQFWHAVTHLGGASVTLTLTIAPLLAPGPLRAAAWHALLTLLLSHLIVHLVKRHVNRPRPSLGVGCHVAISEPDQFSFPSGHSAAAMSVALAYASAYPSIALPAIGAAVAVGTSRVYLGVHYPGDVLMGQLIALAAGIVVFVC